MIEHVPWFCLLLLPPAAMFKYPHFWRYLEIRQRTRLAARLARPGLSAREVTALLASNTVDSAKPVADQPRTRARTAVSAALDVADVAANKRTGKGERLGGGAPIPGAVTVTVPGSTTQVVYVEGNRPLAVAALDLTVTSPTGAAVGRRNCPPTGSWPPRPRPARSSASRRSQRPCSSGPPPRYPPPPAGRGRRPRLQLPSPVRSAPLPAAPGPPSPSPVVPPNLRHLPSPFHPSSRHRRAVWPVLPLGAPHRAGRRGRTL